MRMRKILEQKFNPAHLEVHNVNDTGSKQMNYFLIEDHVQKRQESPHSGVFPQLLNESSGHNVPAGSETHFKVLVVSDSFDSVR